MKRRIIIAFAFFIVSARLLEARALFTFKEAGMGGYGGPQFRATLINDKFALFGGGPANILLTPSLCVGLDWMAPEGDAGGLDFYYGGPRMDYIFFPRSWFHLSIGSMVGAGWFSYQDPDVAGDTARSSWCFAAEPELMASFNILNHERIGIGASYRLIAGSRDIVGLDESGLSGPSVFLKLMYGVYDPGLEPEEKGFIFTGAGSRQFTLLAGRPSMLTGGGTRLLINNKLYIGVGGLTTIIGPRIGNNTLGMMFGGIWSEYVFNPHSLFEFSAGGIAGMGGGGTFNEVTGEESISPMLLADPSLYMSLNVTEFLKLTLGAGYRACYLINEVAGLEPMELSGPTLLVQLRLGGFQ